MSQVPETPSYVASNEAKLLAYTSLCRPVLEYADFVWDPLARSKIHDIELVQNSAVHFISKLNGRADSVCEAKNQLQLQSLEEKRKNHRLCFLTQILQSEDQHRTPSTAYDEIAKDRQLVTVTTRSAARGEPILICTKKSVFHASFLPRTICEMRGENSK